MLNDTNQLTELGLQLPAALQSAAVQRPYAPHQDLFLQGHNASEIFGVLSGRVKLWRTSADGTACTLLLLGTGETLGSVSVAQAGTHLTSATAIDAVIAATWPADLFRSYIRTDSLFANSFLQVVSRRAVQLIERLDDVAGLSVEVRLARLLLRLSGEFGYHDDDFAVVLNLRQQDLADLAFTTVPTISRALSAMKTSGLVETRRGKIVVLNLARVANAAGIHLD